jgi:hypothetical protein
MDLTLALIAALMAITIYFAFYWWTMAARRRASGEHSNNEPVLPTPPQTAIGFVTNFFDTLGIGLYAPCMIMVSLLGMNPMAAFPIMMGSCAFLMPVCSLQFVRKNRYHLRAAVGRRGNSVTGTTARSHSPTESAAGTGTPPTGRSRSARPSSSPFRDSASSA